MNSKKSYVIIEKEDLNRIYKSALERMEIFFKKNKKYSIDYQGKELLVVLAQGGAKHYIDKSNGIKDFDIWFFYKQCGKNYLNIRSVLKSKYENEKFITKEHSFITQVDVMIRSPKGYFNNSKQGIEHQVKKYLNESKNKTPKELKKKPMIGLYPKDVFGKILCLGNER